MMLNLSNLSKTWIFDVDGTIVRHNGYLSGEDVLLDGVSNFFSNLPKDDVVILMTARESQYIESLKNFLNKNNIRYDYIIPNLPHGERILINDIKPSGLKTAFAINKIRDEKLVLDFKTD
jgi:hypothetical protein